MKTYVFSGTTFEVDPRYECTKLIGQGAYGAVCCAVDTITGSKVAIKKVRSVFEDLVDGKRILREVKLLASLHHQNLLTLLDLLRPKDPEHFNDIYIITDFMDADLYQIIRSKQRLVEEQVYYLLYQMCCGLHYIHSAGVVHRDLKPGNLLVNEECDLKICDFGLARGIGECMTDYVVTRWYRPPELLLLCDHYGPAVDMWGVGCIAMELFLRKPLFAGRDYVHQLNLITDVLGTPSEEDLSVVKSESARKYVQSMSRKLPQHLGVICPSKPSAFISFCESLLTLDPRKRLTAKDAMRHELFAQEGLYDISDEQNSSAIFRWDLEEKEEITEMMLRQGMWAEIVRKRPQ